MLELRATMSTVKSHFNEIPYQIPFYQRRYEWTEIQVSELIEDILTHLNSHRNEITFQEVSNPVSISIPKYLIGSVFIYNAITLDENNIARVEKFIIDGQQRMTTITLIAIILKKLIQILLDRCCAAGVVTNLLNAAYISRFIQPLDGIYKFPHDEFDENAELQTKIILNGGIYEQYKRNIRNPDFIENDFDEGNVVSIRFRRNLILIEEIFKNQIEFDNPAINDRDKLNQLCIISGTLINFTNMAVISAHSAQGDGIVHSEVMNVFSKINSRGKDLSQSDMLKVDFLQHTEINLAVRLAEKWEDVFSKEETKQIDTYFNHLYAAINKRFVRTASDAWLVYLKGLSLDRKIELLNNIVFPFFVTGNEVALGNANTGQISLLNGLGFNEWKSVVYSLRMGGNQDEIQNKLEKLLKVCFCFSVNGTYEKVRKQKIEKIFWSDDDGAYVDLIDSAIKKFSDQDVYRIESQKRNFILRCVDRILNGNIGARYDNAILHIEHVLPQNNTNWVGVDGWNEINCNEWVHRVGNLVLLPARINQGIGNLPFREKVARIKNILCENNQNISAYGLRFSLDHQALENITWSPDYVQKRQNFILEQTSNWLRQAE